MPKFSFPSGIASDTPAFIPYGISISGLPYTVLEPQQSDAYRVLSPFGQVLGLLCEDSSAVVTTGSLISLLAEPQIPEFPVPASITQRQLRLELLSVGITDTMVRSRLEGDESGLIEWEYAQEIKRTHPLVGSLGDALGFSSAQIDDMFRSASIL